MFVANSKLRNLMGGLGAISQDISLSDISAQFGRFDYVDTPEVIPLVSGERQIVAGHGIEFVYNAATGLPPFFIEPIRIQDTQNCVIYAPFVIDAIVYVGPGAFLRCDDLGVFIQRTVVYATPAGNTLYDFKALGTVFSVASLVDFAHFGTSLGVFDGVNQVEAGPNNILDYTTGAVFRDVRSVFLQGYIAPGTPTGSGPLIKIEGDKTELIRILRGTPIMLPGQSYIEISPTVSDNAVIVIGNNTYNDTFGGDFFEQGLQGGITAFADNSSSGSITAFADNGAGGTTVTSNAHGLTDGRKVTHSLTTNYNGTFKIFNVTANTYDIATAFVADDATGTWTFNSVTVTTDAPHTLIDGDAVQIAKTTNYNFGREIFGASGSVFSIDDVVWVVDDAAGTWDSGSLKENDPRVTCTSNGDQPDTSQVLSYFSNGVLSPLSPVQRIPAVPGSVVQNQEYDITSDLIPYTIQSDDQFIYNPPGASSAGVIQYVGRPLRAKFTARNAVLAQSGNPDQAIEFRIKKSTDDVSYLTVGAVGVGNLTNRRNIVEAETEVPLNTGDFIKVVFVNVGGTAGVDIVNSSGIAFRIAQGI